MDILAGIFVSAFLAATIVPFPSEAAILAAMQTSEAHRTGAILLAASTGNTLGAAVNWALGRFFVHWRDRRWFPVSGPALDKAQRLFNRYGLWTLLLSWVPIIGDPITVLAGVLNVRFWLFVLLVALAKTGRYAVFLGLIG